MSEIQELTEFLKLLSAETDRKFRGMNAETDRMFREMNAETDRMFREMNAETDRELNTIGRYVMEQSRMIHGIADSNGKYAEQFFYSGLLQSRSLNGQAFSACIEHLKGNEFIGDKDVADEFDIVLKRPDALAIIEVKYRLRKDNVEDLANRKAGNFRLLFPGESAGKVIYRAAAGFSVDGGALKRAKELGIYVLTQKGDAIHLLNDKVKTY